MPILGEARDNERWHALDELQQRITDWQHHNFPNCSDWELALGVAEESGEIADCVLKAHRKLRADEYGEDRLQDAIGDTLIYLIGLCSLRGWKMSQILCGTADLVLKRAWKEDPSR